MAISLDFNSIFNALKPLMSFVLGMVVYSVFIFKFYRFVARKNIFEINFEQYNTSRFAGLQKFISFIFYILKHLIIFPLFVFFWFIVMAVLITWLSETGNMTQIFLVSMAVVASIRVTAYYNEDLSRDFAKMLPFAMLGIYIINSDYFSFGSALVLFTEIPSNIELLVYYLFFVIFLELILRIYNNINTRRKNYLLEQAP